MLIELLVEISRHLYGFKFNKLFLELVLDYWLFKPKPEEPVELDNFRGDEPVNYDESYDPYYDENDPYDYHSERY